MSVCAPDGTDDENARTHAADLVAPVPIWNPLPDQYPPHAPELTTLEITSVTADELGRVALTTTASPEPVVLATDQTVWLCTEADQALLVTVLGLERAAHHEDEDTDA